MRIAHRRRADAEPPRAGVREDEVREAGAEGRHDDGVVGEAADAVAERREGAEVQDAGPAARERRYEFRLVDQGPSLPGARVAAREVDDRPGPRRPRYVRLLGLRMDMSQGLQAQIGPGAEVIRDVRRHPDVPEAPATLLVRGEFDLGAHGQARGVREEARPLVFAQVHHECGLGFVGTGPSQQLGGEPGPGQQLEDVVLEVAAPGVREEDRLRVVEAPGRERAGAADPAAGRVCARAVQDVEALDERQLPAAPRGVCDLRGPEPMEVKVPRARLGAQGAREVRVVPRGAFS